MWHITTGNKLRAKLCFGLGNWSLQWPLRGSSTILGFGVKHPSSARKIRWRSKSDVVNCATLWHKPKHAYGARTNHQNLEDNAGLPLRRKRVGHRCCSMLDCIKTHVSQLDPCDHEKLALMRVVRRETQHEKRHEKWCAKWPK